MLLLLWLWLGIWIGIRIKVGVELRRVVCEEVFGWYGDGAPVAEELVPEGKEGEGVDVWVLEGWWLWWRVGVEIVVVGAVMTAAVVVVGRRELGIREGICERMIALVVGAVRRRHETYSFGSSLETDVAFSRHVKWTSDFDYLGGW